MQKIVVVGAGQAGATVAATLRGEGFEGQITMLGAETAPPYQRPPLSKGYLLGEMPRERLFLRAESFYADQNIDLRVGVSANVIDRAAKVVRTDAGEFSYDALVLTTGATPRRLPPALGGDLAGVHVVRTLDDVDHLAPEVIEGRHALIVGGGYIGLEAAAICRKRGLHVTLIETADRILQRVAAPATSAYFRALHEDHGVNVREGLGVARLMGTNGRVSSAVLSDLTEMPIDLAVIGIGVLPNTDVAAAAGLAIGNGIAVDVFGRTSDPDVYAAGDCASFPYRGTRVRLESVQNAIDQGEIVACNILGQARAYDPVPWFWSDQYDVKLQIAGLNTGYDRVVVRDGGTARSHWYYAGDTLLAVDAMNDPRAYMVGKRLLEGGRNPDAALVGDATVDLKGLLRG